MRCRWLQVIDDWRPWHAGTNQNDTSHFITAGYVTVYNAATSALPPSSSAHHNTSQQQQCALFTTPNCSISAGAVTGFSTEHSAADCCAACAAKKPTCKFYHFRNIDSGCTQYDSLSPAAQRPCPECILTIGMSSKHQAQASSWHNIICL